MIQNQIIPCTENTILYGVLQGFTDLDEKGKPHKLEWVTTKVVGFVASILPCEIPRPKPVTLTQPSCSNWYWYLIKDSTGVYPSDALKEILGTYTIPSDLTVSELKKLVLKRFQQKYENSLIDWA